jgi:hypothetical protein
VAIKIGSSGKECCQCRKRFQVGESYYSLLLLGEEQSLGREDRCRECWAGFGPPARSAWWLTRRREESRARVDFESVKALFFQLVNQEGEEVAGLRYVTALLLIRRRVCKLIDTVYGPEGEILRLEFQKGEGKVYRVPVPDLGEEGLERLKENLKQALTLEE